MKILLGLLVLMYFFKNEFEFQIGKWVFIKPVQSFKIHKNGI